MRLRGRKGVPWAELRASTRWHEAREALDALARKPDLTLRG
jgi:hypothetical protein